MMKKICCAFKEQNKIIKVSRLCSPIAIQSDGRVRQDAQHQADGGGRGGHGLVRGLAGLARRATAAAATAAAVDAQQAGLLVVGSALARHHHQVAGASRVRAFQLHRLRKHKRDRVRTLAAPKQHSHILQKGARKPCSWQRNNSLLLRNWITLIEPYSHPTPKILKLVRITEELAMEAFWRARLNLAFRRETSSSWSWLKCGASAQTRPDCPWAGHATVGSHRSSDDGRDRGPPRPA